MKHLVSQYPVTREYLDKISEIADGPVETVVVSTITARGYIGILQQFLRLKSEGIYVPVFDAASRSLLPPLQILSMLARCPQRVVVEQNFDIHQFGYTSAVVGAAKILLGCLFGSLTVFHDWFRLGRLLKEPRILTGPSAGNDILYLKTNLLLGVQAGGAIAHTAGIINGLLQRGNNVEVASVEKTGRLGNKRFFNDASNSSA